MIHVTTVPALQHCREPGAYGFAARLESISNRYMGSKVTLDVAVHLVHELADLANEAIVQLNEAEARAAMAITAAARANGRDDVTIDEYLRDHRP